MNNMLITFISFASLGKSMKKRFEANCENCDWRNRDSSVSSKGNIIYCEYFRCNKVIEEISDCPGWSENLRIGNEGLAEFMTRQRADRLDAERHILAHKAHRRATIALFLSGISLLIVLIKFILDLIKVGFLSGPP